MTCKYCDKKLTKTDIFCDRTCALKYNDYEMRGLNKIAPIIKNRPLSDKEIQMQEDFIKGNR